MYNGWLIKVGEYTIPTDRFVKASEYSVTRNTQDLDSYRDANGVLHRETLDYVADKVEFQTPAMLTNDDVGELFRTLRANFTNQRERKANVTMYIPELDDYVTQEMYMVNPQIGIYGNYGGKIHYNPFRIAFIGYGVKEE